MRARRAGEGASTILPARGAKAGDYRPEAAARLSERAGQTMRERAVTRDRFRDFKGDNPGSGREDFERLLRDNPRAYLPKNGR